MVWLVSFITFIFGIALGGRLQKRLQEKLIRLEELKKKLKKKNKFVEILEHIKHGDSEFKSRLNESVYISMYLSEYGEIDLIFVLDKNEILVFHKNQLILNTEDVDSLLIGEIIGQIYKKYSKEINDVVEVLGVVIYKKDFEKSFNIKSEEIKKLNIFSQDSDMNEVDKINLANSNKFDIDEILDKISAFGISILSPEEKQFLDNFGNDKTN